MRAIARTASTGWAPTDVSWDSITASVPSQIALATSDASARVGRFDVTIDSSISVAVMTGTPARFAWSITSFWTAGTSPSFSSTPRSPRALAERLPQLDVADLDVVRCGRRPADEGDRAPSDQPQERALDRAGPDLRPLQVAQQSYGPAGRGRRLAHVGGRLPVRAGVAV